MYLMSDNHFVVFYVKKYDYLMRCELLKLYVMIRRIKLIYDL